MALAPSAPGAERTQALAAVPEPIPTPRVIAPDTKVAPRPNPTWAEQAFAPAAVLVGAIVDASSADLGWLSWLDRTDPVVVRREALSPVEASLIGEFPEPPLEPVIIEPGAASGAWPLWCRARGIRSCVVVPVFARDRVIGTMGLASSSIRAIGPNDVRQLELVSSLAVHARTYEARLAGQRRLFAEVSRSLENALALDRAIRQPPTYQELARAVGESLNASYCLIAIHDSRGVLTIRAAAGRRPPRRMGVASWQLSRLRGCARALRDKK